MILLIKKLLREEKYTIEGAKKILSDPAEFREVSMAPQPKPEPVQPVETVNTEHRDLKSDLEQLRNFLVDLRSKI